MAFVQRVKSTGQLFGELWRFMRRRKKLWMLPIIFVLVVFGTFLFLTQGSVLAPFIYALF